MEWDWCKIKTEYIGGTISMEKLCAKYAVPYHRLRRVAEKEKWTSLKAEAKQKASEKIVENIANLNAEHSLKIYEVADKLLDKISESLDDIAVIGSQGIKNFTSALKDIKDIKGIKSDLDLREQQARIDKLRKDAMVESGDKVITVTFEKEIDKYAD